MQKMLTYVLETALGTDAASGSHDEDLGTRLVLVPRVGRS